MNHLGPGGGGGGIRTLGAQPLTKNVFCVSSIYVYNQVSIKSLWKKACYEGKVNTFQMNVFVEIIFTHKNYTLFAQGMGGINGLREDTLSGFLVVGPLRI